MSKPTAQRTTEAYDSRVLHGGHLWSVRNRYTESDGRSFLLITRPSRNGSGVPLKKWITRANAKGIA